MDLLSSAKYHEAEKIEAFGMTMGREARLPIGPLTPHQEKAHTKRSL
ncbi:MAG: hypothetical protein ACK56F_07065 [bacterium]